LVSKKSTNYRSPLLLYMDQALEGDGLLEEADAELEELRLEQYVLKARKMLGLSQTELAKKAGIAQPHLSRLEAGQARNITLRTLFRTAAALGNRVQIKFVPSARATRSKNILGTVARGPLTQKKARRAADR
jgi:transcriptional regulator with XRE-family HTH domain